MFACRLGSSLNYASKIFVEQRSFCLQSWPLSRELQRTSAVTPAARVTGTSTSTEEAKVAAHAKLGVNVDLRSMVHTRAQEQSRGQPTRADILYTVQAAHSHIWQGNQEGPRRIDAIEKELHQQHLTTKELAQQLSRIDDAKPATEEQVLRVHDPEYHKWLRETVKDSTPKVVADPEVPEEVTYVTSTSYSDAMQAAGAATRLVDEVVAASQAGPADDCPIGFSIARPPGHHAGVRTASGFCLLNNVAIAARHAQAQHGLNRVLILDYDVHCGNGTVDIFYEDPSVLVVDMHEVDVWPHTGDMHQTGRGRGRGTTLDIPIPAGSGHASAAAVFDRIVVPAAQRFKPDILLVSAGYDAHWRDPLAGLNFQSSTYHLLAQRLKLLAAELCGGRLVFVLEGGYSSEGLASSVAETFLGLLGRPPVHPLDSSVPAEPQEAVDKLIHSVRILHGLEPVM